jgi:alkylation response protein AidB-like acyl-CoA dehydrogenase
VRAAPSAPPRGESSASPIDALGELTTRIRASADEIERGRRLPIDLVDALARRGVFRICVPRSLGGGELPVVAMIEVLEEIARADGSAGWCAMIGATSGLLAAYLPEGDAHEIYGRNPAMVTGGVFAPSGKAIASADGYRVSGRWPFASGCQHCGWLMGGSVVFDDGKPRLLPSGLPDSRLMLFPAGEVEIIDTWTVSGLRGTGSHDISVRDAFVPTARSVSLMTDRPQAAGALYVFPVFGLLAIGIAAVALGIARRAIEELTQLAGGKMPTGSRRLLVERPIVQMQVSEAEGTLRAARAFLVEAVADAWEAAVANGTITTGERALVRLAATHATLGAARVVDLMYNAGGGSAVYAASVLQRQFRDIHVVTQHMMVAPPTLELAGRILLGLDADTAML